MQLYWKQEVWTKVAAAIAKATKSGDELTADTVARIAVLGAGIQATPDQFNQARLKKLSNLVSDIRRESVESVQATPSVPMVPALAKHVARTSAGSDTLDLLIRNIVRSEVEAAEGRTLRAVRALLDAQFERQQEAMRAHEGRMCKVWGIEPLTEEAPVTAPLPECAPAPASEKALSRVIPVTKFMIYGVDQTSNRNLIEREIKNAGLEGIADLQWVSGRTPLSNIGNKFAVCFVLQNFTDATVRKMLKDKAGKMAVCPGSASSMAAMICKELLEIKIARAMQ